MSKRLGWSTVNLFLVMFRSIRLRVTLEMTKFRRSTMTALCSKYDGVH